MAEAATYQVVETGELSSHKYSYGQQVNNQGDSVFYGASLFDFPVQFSLLSDTDFENIKSLASANHANSTYLNDIEDFEALKAGTPTANDLAWTLAYLTDSTRSSSLFYQKIAENTVFYQKSGQVNFLHIFDQPLDDGRYTYSTNNFVNGITNDGWIYGNASAPYLPQLFTNSDGDEVRYWTRTFTSRGYLTIDNGTSYTEIVPPEATYGGESAILGMNDNFQGVGYVSTKLNALSQSTIEDETSGCASADILAAMPFDACISSLKENLYHLSAAKFQFDASGNLISTELLGDFITPNEDDTRVYKSYAQAINNNGVAVGFSHGWIDETVTEPTSTQSRNFYAVVYKNGEVIDITPDHGVEFDSRLYDINDQGIAVGYVTKFINGNQRTKAFTIDTTKETMEKVFIDDFFTGSSSKAFAINNQGYVVGSGEVESHNDQQSTTGSTNPRRTHGFIYSIAENKFTDLNDFLSCDSPYTIIEARGINEQNQIMATALVTKSRRDVKGQIMLDSDGNPLEEDVLRAVTLTPIDGEIEDCSANETKVERQGAVIHWWLLMLITLAGVWRRR
jgi:hypothetical protein